MKRIAAVAALIVAMLAVPAAAAMASTSTSGSGHAVQYQFCQPSPFQHRHHNRHHGRNHFRNHGHHRRFNYYPFYNCNLPMPPASGVCNGASFTFSWVSGADGIYEISGPALYTGEQFSYNGGLYTIVLANTLAGSMTLNSVNYGPTIFSATGYLC